jgi:hypothetical protein
MHCTIEDLVALRDGEGSVWARRHVVECPTCQTEMDALYQRVAALRALPPLVPPRDRWTVVRDGLRAERRGRRWRLVGLAAAAALAGILVARPFGARGTAHAELALAKERSASIESRLEGMQDEGRVVSGREAALAAALEDRIAVIDGRLGRLDDIEAVAPEAELLNLWRQRVDLMEQLYTVRVTRAVYVGL